MREAVLFIEKHAGDAAEVRLNYLVANCGWAPTYTMRASADRKQVRVEYNALIHQLTGEDWAGVTLTLSTASPTLAAAGPGLAPFHVTLASSPVTQDPNGSAIGGMAFGMGANKVELQAQIAGAQLAALRKRHCGQLFHRLRRAKPLQLDHERSGLHGAADRAQRRRHGRKRAARRGPTTPKAPA